MYQPVLSLSLWWKECWRDHGPLKNNSPASPTSSLNRMPKWTLWPSQYNNTLMPLRCYISLWLPNKPLWLTWWSSWPILTKPLHLCCYFLGHHLQPQTNSPHQRYSNTYNRTLRFHQRSPTKTGDPSLFWGQRHRLTLLGQPLFHLSSSPTRPMSNYSHLLHDKDCSSMVSVDAQHQPTLNMGGLIPTSQAPVWSVRVHQPRGPVIQTQTKNHGAQVFGRIQMHFFSYLSSLF